MRALLSALRGWARAQARLLVGLLLAGVAVGLLWRLAVPLTARFGDDQETSIAVDLTLALLGLLAGVLTALRFVTAPGPRPVARGAAAVFGSLLAGLISWPVGDLVGRPGLTTPGAALLWPVTTAVLVFAYTLLPAGARRLNAA